MLIVGKYYVNEKPEQRFDKAGVNYLNRCKFNTQGAILKDYARKSQTIHLIKGQENI